MKLREYQARAIADTYAALRKYTRVILQLPTGAGKSIIAVRIMQAALRNEKRVLFIVERKTLKDQIAEHCNKHKIEYGIQSGDDPRYSWGAPVQIGTIQTLARRSNIDHGFGYDLIIVDEAHLIYRHQKQIMADYANAKFLGLTATPYTKGLGLLWEHLVKGPSVRELIDQGHLCDYIAYAPPAGQIDTKGVKLNAGEYNERELYDRANNDRLFANITDEWQSKAAEVPTLVFAININHSRILCERFKALGIHAEHLDCYSDDDHSRACIEAFKRGEITVLSSVFRLAIGFDAPNAGCAILARPTKSLILHRQMLGRVLRPAPGKEKAIILDHSSNLERLGLPDDDTDYPLDTKNVSDRKLEGKKPRICKACGMVSPGNPCSNCGKEVKLRPVAKESTGKLQLITPNSATGKRKLEWMHMLKAIEIERRFKNGWSIYMYKEKFGEEPSHRWVRAIVQPDDEVRKFVRYQDIKRSHRKLKHGN